MRYWFTGLILMVAIFAWIVLTEMDFEKYDSLEKALEKGIPFSVKEVVHIQKIDGVTVVMYTTEPDRQQIPNADYDALAVAFFEGDDQKGWKNIGPHGWEHYENDNMTVYVTPLRESERHGNTKYELYIVYGEIHNDEISKIETKTKEELVE